MGSWVTVRLSDKRFGSNHAWQIIGEQGPRLVVKTNIEGVMHTIAVKPEACKALTILPVLDDAQPDPPATAPMIGVPSPHSLLAATVVPYEASPVHLLWTEQVLSSLAAAGALDQRISLPGMGGNSVTLARLENSKIDVTSLLGYPSLAHQGIGLNFHSTEFSTTIVMGFCDILVWCPAKHVWPFCGYCQKILLPPGNHRESIKHKKALEWARHNGTAWAANWAQRPCHRPQMCMDESQVRGLALAEPRSLAPTLGCADSQRK